jgi:hypothetical protein
MPIVIRSDIERCNSCTWQTRLAELNDAYVSFERLGVTTVSASRINAYRNAIQSFMEAAAGKRKFDMSLAVRIMNASVEVYQLQKIVQAAESSSQREMWRCRLVPLISGAESPKDESAAASARDAQFESFIGAVFELSGFAVEFTEPDLIVSDDSQRFAIAAKRPRNARAIDRNCKKAVRQLRRAGLPGLIALDLSFALQADLCINGDDARAALQYLDSIANGFVFDNRVRLKELCDEPCVFGILAHVLMPFLNYGCPDGPELANAIRWTVAPFCDSESEGVAWGKELSAKCAIGLFGASAITEDAGAAALSLISA